MLGARSCNHCCSGKALCIIHSEFLFVALGFQHARRMNHTVICGMPPGLHFFTSSHKRYDFRGGVGGELPNIKCIFRIFLQLLYETFFILRRTERNMIINVYSLRPPPSQCHHMSLMDFVVSPPGCGRSVTDF
jgi:hypothetical protein